MSDKFTTKLGKTSKAGERTRIWIEGARLIKAGFEPGTLYRRNWDADAGRLTLRVIDQTHFDELARDEKGTVSGKGAKPIIDIVGSRVRDMFGEGDTVTVEYHRHVIHISR
jgi:hypothetical protein